MLVIGGFWASCSEGQAYPAVTPQVTPAFSQQQAVQRALQEAQTLDLTPYFGGGPIVRQVDPNPNNVTFDSLGGYPKWLITIDAVFFWPMGHSNGSIQVQVAADTGEIDNTNVTTAPINESTPAASPSPNSTATPSPTPSSTPSHSPSVSPSPTPSASVDEFPSWVVLLILVGAAVMVACFMKDKKKT